jgi:F-type H+-transporting ATPase subunit b
MGVLLVALAENSIQLVPDGTLVVHILMIWIMVAILDRTLFKPVNKVLAEREEKTKGRHSETEGVLARVNQRLHEYEGQLREARTEGYREMEELKSESVRERDQKIQKLKDEMGNWLVAQKAELNQQSNAVRDRLTSESSEIGAQIASRILGRPMDGAGR